MENTEYKVNTEIERKYIIAMPDVNHLETLKDVSKTEIIQTYLISQNGGTRRVRKTVQNGKTCFIYNEKTPINSMTRLEKEIEVCEEEYNKLIKKADTSLSIISKTRYSVPFMGYIYEIDIYNFSISRAILEVELPNESVIPPIPKFISVIKEVTEDIAFCNFSIAKAVPKELTL